jgi:hypothetical protein
MDPTDARSTGGVLRPGKGGTKPKLSAGTAP